MTYRLKILKGAVILGISQLGSPQYVIPDAGLCRLLDGLSPVYLLTKWVILVGAGSSLRALELLALPPPLPPRQNPKEI